MLQRLHLLHELLLPLLHHHLRDHCINVADRCELACRRWSCWDASNSCWAGWRHRRCRDELGVSGTVVVRVHFHGCARRHDTVRHLRHRGTNCSNAVGKVFAKHVVEVRGGRQQVHTVGMGLGHSKLLLEAEAHVPELVNTVREAASIPIDALPLRMPSAEGFFVANASGTEFGLAMGEVANGLVTSPRREGLAESSLPQVGSPLKLIAGVGERALVSVLALASEVEGAEPGALQLLINRIFVGLARHREVCWYACCAEAGEATKGNDPQDA
mmetsp:Transcript_16917/g.43092  ORF Transcript_16917/g.43092 Transcript_16917/m.43092 type:complete len:272 (+) Transcript_16917:239-1054(+)